MQLIPTDIDALNLPVFSPGTLKHFLDSYYIRGIGSGGTSGWRVGVVEPWGTMFQ